MGDIEKGFEQKPKKKTWKIIVLIFIILIIAALLFGYFVIFKSPKTVFSLAMDKLVNSLEAQKYDTAKISMEMQMEVDSDDIYAKEIAEAFNKLKIKYDTLIDLKNKQDVLDISLDYDNQNAIDVQMVYNEDGSFLLLKDIYDKYIELDLNSDPNFESINLNSDIFDQIIQMQEKQDDYIKAIKIIEKEVKKSILKEGKFSKESDTLEMNGKDVKVTKNKMDLSAKNLGKVLKTVSKNLSKNDKFLDLFDESPKEMLKEVSENIDTSGTTSKDKIVVSIYTKGLLNEFVGIEFEMFTSDYDGKMLGLSIMKEDKDTYSFKYEYPTISYSYPDPLDQYTLYEPNLYTTATIEGKVKIEKEVDKKDRQEGTITVEIEVPDAGTVRVISKYKVEYDVKADKVNISNSISPDNITDKEKEEMLDKLSKRPLIGEILESMNASLFIKAKEVTEEVRIQQDQEKLKLEIAISISNSPNSKLDLSTFKPEGFTKNSDGTYTSQNGNKFKVDEEGNITYVEELKTDPKTIIDPNPTVSQNEVTNYTYKVGYSVPSDFTYQSSYSSDGYKYYKTGDYTKGIDATVSIGWYSDQEMTEYVKGEYDFEKDYSEDATLSDIKTIEVNGKTFKYQTMSYNFLNVKHTDVYVWYTIDNSYVFRVEFQGYDMEPTEDMIKGFLNITASKV